MNSLVTRRDLFGRAGPRASQQRPPWTRPEAAFLDACTRCGACIEACPTGVLVRGRARYPTVDFSKSGCSFCTACVTACPADCFLDATAVPWSIKADVDARCLETRGVSCRVCEDACEPQAIRFRPQRGGTYAATVARETCTGCGVCVIACPVGAIGIGQPNRHHEVTS